MNGTIHFHFAHCIDYLRQYLMCHSDLTLKASRETLYFTKNHEHQCRDFDALHGWVKRNAWPGFLEYFAENESRRDELRMVNS